MNKINRSRALLAALCVLALTNVPNRSFAQDPVPTPDPVQPAAPLVLAPDAPPTTTSPTSTLAPEQALTETAKSDQLEFTLDETLVRQKALNARGADAATASATDVHPDAATVFAVIKGKVTAGDTGLPVSYVAVAMYDASHSYLYTTYTDRAGTYTLYSFDSITRPVFLRVNPAGVYPYMFAPEWYDNQPTFTSATSVTIGGNSTVSNIDFVLDKGAQITGVVNAADTGLPLAGVRVYVIDASGDSVDYIDTDAAGQYTTDGLQTGSYRLFFNVSTSIAPTATQPYLSEYYAGQATLSSAMPITISAPSVITGVNAALTLGASITGVVTAEDTGKPMTNTQVTLLSAEFGSNFKNVSTDAAGDYAFTGLPTGRYKVQFYASSSSSSSSDAPLYNGEFYNDKPSLSTADIISLTASTTLTSVNAQLNPRGSITGVVTALDTGLPISGVVVDLQSILPIPPECFLFGLCSGVSTTTLTDAQGRYTISASARAYRLYFNPRSTLPYCSMYYNNAFDSNHIDLVQVPRTGVQPNMNVALALPGQISGTVRTADTGAPMNNVQVLLYNGNTSGRFNYSTSTTTNTAGQYVFSGRCNGIYTIRFGPNTYPSYPSVGPTPTPFVAPNATATATPTRSSVAAAEPTSTTYVIPTATPIVGSSDSSQYMAEYYNDQPTFAGATKLYFKAPTNMTGINAALDLGGFFIGKVTAKDTGQPLQGVSVYVDNSEYASATTDVTGAYRIGPLRPGPYKLAFYPGSGSAEARQYAFEYFDHKPSSNEADPVFISGQKTSTIDMALDRPGTITGKISFAEPVSNTNMNVRLYDLMGNYAPSTYPNINGNYTFSGVAPGSYKVLSVPSDRGYAIGYYAGKPAWTTADVITVTAAMTTSNVDFVLQKGSYITGRITDSVTGAGVRYPSVSIYEAGDARFSVDTTVDAAGYYTSVRPLPTGGYKIRFGDSLHLTQYSGGKPTLAEAAIITVTAPTTTTVNASLVPFSALPLRQYLPFITRE